MTASDRTVYIYPSWPGATTTSVYHLLRECGNKDGNEPHEVKESIARMFGRRGCQTCQGILDRNAMLEEARSVLPTGILDDLARCLEDVPGVEFRILWVRPGTTSPRILWTSKGEEP